MPLGLTGNFNILQHSPHDLLAPPPPTGPVIESIQRWVPSRYNVQATAEDGRLVLWNTLSGKMSVFQTADRDAVLGLLRRPGFEAPQEKVVGYLVGRGYLVRQGVDEYRQFQQLFGQEHYRTDALELILMSSEDCNFRCTYCYEDFTRGTMIREVREGIKNLVRKRIKRLNRLTVGWFGGEPLYGWEAVEDLAPFFVEIADEHEVPFSAHMTTNGYLLTPEVADKLFIWRIRHFQITLDGLAEHHNHSRAARNGGPTFERIFDNLKSLVQRKEHFQVLLRLNFDHANAGGISEFVDLLSREFTNDPRFSLAMHAVSKLGGPNDSQLGVCTDDEAGRIQREIQAQAQRQGLNVGNLRNAARMGSKVCYAARPYNFLIGATGKVMKCTVLLDKSDYNVVGRITEKGDLELDKDRMALWTEPAFEHDKQCQKCVVLPSCQGISCPVIRIEHNIQPCISTRRHHKAELLGILDAPDGKGRRVAVWNSDATGREHVDSDRARPGNIEPPLASQ
jgi:uncharacterized protein